MWYPRSRHAAVMILATVGAILHGGCAKMHIQCVTEGTLIATPSGEQPIESLAIGDTDCSLDAAGRPTTGKVTAVHRGWTSELIELKFEDDSRLLATPEHLVATSHGWITTEQLAASDIVTRPAGEPVITSVRELSMNARVYDLSVEPHQSYIANGVVVHNKTVARGFTKEMRNQPLTFVTAKHRYWIDLSIEPGRAFRVRRLPNYQQHWHSEVTVETLKFLSWEAPGIGRHLTIVMKSTGAAKIKVAATVIGTRAKATVTEDGKTIAQDIPLQSVSSQEMEFAMLRDAASGTMSPMIDKQAP